MSDVDDLYLVYRGSVPPEITATSLGEDIGYALAEIFSRAKQEIDRLNAGAILATSTGLFTDAHARDRGLRRQDGETDEQLIIRLRRPPLAGTVTSIIEAVEEIIGVGTVYLIELPRHSAYYDRLSFFDRGERMGGGRGVVIVMIPQSANAKDSVSDAVRSKVSAGKLYLIEEYVG